LADEVLALYRAHFPSAVQFIQPPTLQLAVGWFAQLGGFLGRTGDEAALRRERVHFEDLWGPATVQYEPDVAIILNREVLSEESSERWVRIAAEKNRHGPSEAEFRHRLLGAQYALHPVGEAVLATASFQAERTDLGPRRQIG
jgi:hypothetical protein